MAIFYPDILEHNNPNNPLMDSSSLKGGALAVVSVAQRNLIPIAKRTIGYIVSQPGVTARYDGIDVSDVNWTNAANWTTLLTVSSVLPASSISVNPQLVYLTNTTLQGQLDQTESNLIGLYKIDKTDFKNLYQTGRARVDLDTSVVSISPADTLNITAVDNILFVNEIVPDTPANKVANFLLSFGNRTFVANATNTLLPANTRGIFYVGIDKLGSPVFRTSKVYDQDVCYLARLIVANTAGVYSIISFKYFPDLANNRVNNHDRLTLSSGYIVPSGAASISFGNRAVTFSKNSINYSINKFDPNYLTIADTVNPTPLQFLFALPNLTSLATSIALSTTINPTQWYNAGGTVGAGAVGGANYQVYRLLVSVTGTLIIQTKASTSNAPAFGVNAIFANRDDALAGLTSVVFPDILPLGDAIPLGTFYLRAGTAVNGSQMNDPNDFLFRGFTASSSSSSTGVTAHDLLSGKNDNPTYQHVTTTDIANWNAKPNDLDVVHKANPENITGRKTWTLPVDQGAIAIDMPASINSSPDSILFKIRGSNNPAGGFTTSTYTEMYNIRNVAHWVTPQVGAEYNCAFQFSKLDGVINNIAFRVSNSTEDTFVVDDLGNLTAQNGTIKGEFHALDLATFGDYVQISQGLEVGDIVYCEGVYQITEGIDLVFNTNDFTNTSKLIFQTGNSVTRQVILPNGNVGIGTTTPAFKTTIQPLSNVISLALVQDNSVDYGFGFKVDSTNGFLNLNRISGGIDNGTLLTVSSGGNVGIGTSNPLARVSIAPATNHIAGGEPTLRICEVGGNEAFGLGLSCYPVSGSYYTGKIQAKHANVGSPILLNPEGGNIGIGMEDPQSKLDIVTGIGVGINWRYSAGFGNNSISNIFDGSNDAVNAMMFNVNNTAGNAIERMRINGIGNVLIGSTDDNGSRLQVYGQAYVYDTSYFNDQITIRAPYADFTPVGSASESAIDHTSIFTNTAFVTKSNTAYYPMLTGHNVLDGLGWTNTPSIGFMRPDVPDNGNSGEVVIQNSGDGTPLVRWKFRANGDFESQRSVISNTGTNFGALRTYSNTYIGIAQDYEQAVILLHEVYYNAGVLRNSVNGVIEGIRGNSAAGLNAQIYNINTASAYTQVYGSLNTIGVQLADQGLFTCMYNGLKYICIKNTEVPGKDFVFRGDLMNTSNGQQLLLVVYNNTNTGVVNAEVANSLAPFVPPYAPNIQGGLTVKGIVSIGQYTNGTAMIDAHNGIAFYGNNSPENGIAINDSGWVGVNSTVAYHNSKFTVGGKVFLSQGNNSDLGGALYGYNDNSIYNFEGGLKFESYKFNGSGYAMTTAVIVSGQGNVGIGGVHPVKKLHVGVIHDVNQDEEIRIGSVFNQFYGLALNYRINSTGGPLMYLAAYDGGTRYDTIRLAGNDIVVAGNTQSVTFNGVKRYKATLSQAGTNAPTVNNLFESTLGNIVWSYDNLGRYIGTLAGAFVGKINIELSNNLVYTETGAVYTYCLRQDNNTIILISLRNNNPVNDYLNNIVVTIEKYP